MTDRVLCPNCLRYPALKKDGTMRKHVVEAYGGRLDDGTSNWCIASGMTSEDAIRKGHVAANYSDRKKTHP